MAVYGLNRCAAIGGARSALGRSRLRSQIVDAPTGEDEERQTTRRAALYRRARGARSPAENPHGDAVFPGRSGSPLSYASFATAPAKAGIDACTPHGWRSCFRDWCGDIAEVPRDLAEAALAHSLNATEGAYCRMTTVERRREVMTRYADWLNDERGKVLAFPIGKTV